jgi:hypothetical protein
MLSGKQVWGHIKHSGMPDSFDWALLTLWALVSVLLVVRYKTAEASFDELVGALILWFTAYAVVRTAKANYRLEKITQEQVKVSQEQVKVAQETRMDQFMPVVVPADRSIIQGDNMTVYLHNIGNGIAKEASIWLHGITVMEDFSIPPGEPIQVSVEINNQNIEMITGREKPSEMFMEVRYKDIYDRSLRTVEIVFNRDEIDPGDRYSLQHGKWRFQRI